MVSVSQRRNRLQQSLVPPSERRACGSCQLFHSLFQSVLGERRLGLQGCRLAQRHCHRSDHERHCFVISKYSDSNGCDLWEEQRGLHFFTVAVQRRAIYEVCDFANFLSDATSAATYAAAATNLDAKLTTFWNANAHVFRAATAYVKAGSITVTALNQKLFNAGAPVGLGLKAYGDKHIRRFKLHGAADNHFNEQFNRNTGVAQGVNDLTWSYAALISTNNARAELKALSP
ncbi:unnamed protein product [Aphanomyces euteiches]